MDLSSGTTLSHYRIVSKLGAGGMGEVYLAQDTSELGRQVALKLLPAQVAENKDRLRRFIQEARAVSNLNHPNILTVHEFGQSESGSFMATEFVDGVALREYVTKRRLKLIELLDLAIQIVAALNAAHEAGVTHRDLKPENVMVRPDQIVKVLDFGLAKLAEPPGPAGSSAAGSNEEVATQVMVRTQPGLVMGTVGYMSPEQSAGAVVDHRTDIWSMGVVLYEMVAGSLPFQGKDIYRQIIAIQEADQAPLSQQAQGVPERLEEIVAKCLAKEPQDRYQTARDLWIDLRNLRRKLDVNAEIERIEAPDFDGASFSGRTLVNRAAAPETRVMSSAEYLVTGIKRHKLATAFVAAGLLVIAAGIGLAYHYGRARNPAPAIDSIAVLPFSNGSNDPNSDYLTDGVTESIINRLTQLPNLRVIARTSVFRYKGKETDPLVAGKDLGVRAVLVGRLMQRGDEIDISTELIDVRENKQLWGERFESKASGLMSMQRNIAAQIADNLRLQISSAEHDRMMKHYTDNLEAYQLYLQARYYWNKRNGEALKKSIEYFNQAIDRDPNYALAYSGLADAYSLLASYGAATPEETLPKARAAAHKAVELDDNLAEAHASLGNLLGTSDWQWAEATRELQRAIALNPNYATAHHWYSDGPLLAQGRLDEAMIEMNRARELDPFSLIIISELGANYIAARQYDMAIEQLRKAIEMDPSFYFAHWNLGQAYAFKRNFPAALAEYREARRLSDDPGVLGFVGQAYALSGEKDEALKTLAEMKAIMQKRYVNAYAFALVYAGLGDKDQAFAWLEKSYQAHGPELILIKTDPGLDNLRSDRRYEDLLHRMNL